MKEQWMSADRVPAGAQMSVAATKDQTRGHQLREGAMSLPSVVMQCVGEIGPAASSLFIVPSIVLLAGTSAALALLLGFVLMLTAAVPLGYLARELPSAGGYYTYISRSLHPRVGFLASWAWTLYTPIVGAYIFSILGYILHNALLGAYGINYPWWVTVFVGVGVLSLIAWRDVRVSGRALIIFGSIEMTLMLVLSIWGLIRPGHGGFSLAPFDPLRSLSKSGFYLAIVFSIFALTGWEAAAPAAEEARNPRRAIPLALVGSTVLCGLFFVVVAWGLTVGWGLDRLGLFGASSVSPAIVLAQKYWSGAWWLVLFAVTNSAFAVAIASNNVSTRMWFAMARSGSLPRFLGHVHPVRKTPTNAVLIQSAITLVVGLGLGFWIGPFNEFLFFGLASTVVLVVVYSLGNAGVVRFFWLAKRPDRKFFVHFLLPIVSILLLLYVGYKSIIPLPTGAVGWAPLVAGLWALIGVGVLIAMRRRGREAWLLASRQTMSELSDDRAEAIREGVVPVQPLTKAGEVIADLAASAEADRNPPTTGQMGIEEATPQ
jgi:amino acid transporter